MNFKEALKFFPGGTQLFSKRPTNYSEKYPYDYVCAQGTQIWTYDKVFTDMSTMSQGACILGYCNQSINYAVKDEIDRGNISSLNSKMEIFLAKKLQEYEPGKMFRYFKSGGEAMSAAARTVRAHTGKSIILTNGYNGWHDWYLSANINEGAKNHLNITTHAGVPEEIKGTCFYFDTLESLEKLVKNHNGKIAGIVIEVSRYELIDADIIEYLKTSDIPIIVDEITTGWRFWLGGMYQLFDGFEPDIVVYGKAISNGYPFSVICGKKEVMRAIDKTFISSTYWTDSIGMAAAYQTILELERSSYIKRNLLNKKLACALEKKFGVVDGFPGMIHYKPKNRRKWIDFMLGRGYLVTDQIYLSFAHTDQDIDYFIEVMKDYESK